MERYYAKGGRVEKSKMACNKPKKEFILEVFKSFNFKWLEIKVNDLKVNEL